MTSVQQPVKKLVIKKKKNDTTSENISNNDQPLSEVNEVSSDNNEEITSCIPSSRVKNYISKEKLNKTLDSLINTIKESDPSTDLNSLLSEDLQAQLGSLIKKKEENGEEINLNNLVVDILSKQKYKFSNTSFKVLSVFLDIMIEELTLNVMNEIIKNKKSIINTKYAFNNNESPLYNIYSTLPTYISEQALLNKSSDEVSEEVSSEEELDESSSTHSINFEFYVRKICNKLKKTKEEFNKIKVSNNYQKFCSNLILEFLDRVAPMTTIVLEVMTTKTITNLVFETVIKLQLYNNSHCDSIMNEVKMRLS